MGIIYDNNRNAVTGTIDTAKEGLVLASVINGIVRNILVKRDVPENIFLKTGI